MYASVRAELERRQTFWANKATCHQTNSTTQSTIHSDSTWSFFGWLCTNEFCHQLWKQYLSLTQYISIPSDTPIRLGAQPVTACPRLAFCRTGVTQALSPSAVSFTTAH